MSHYYTSNLETKSNVQKFTVTLRGEPLTFYTDHGVFSKQAIDFGTRLLIESYEYQANHRKLLDMGCGYGPIGISLAKKFSNLWVDMVDVNERALELCERNRLENGIENGRVFYSDLYAKIEDTYDVILTNPPIRAGKNIVHRIFEEGYHYLNKNGELWVVIRKQQGAPSAKKKLEEIFGNCTVVTRDSGYYVLKSVK